MGAVPPGTPIRLDATPLGRPLYRRFGFEDEDRLTRHVADPPSRAGPTPDQGAYRVRSLAPADLPAVTALDDRIFGAQRRMLLEWALESAGQYAQVIDTDAGAQYCFGRPGRLFDQIGPVVAAGDDTAIALVSASLLAAGTRAVVVDAFDRHSGFTGWLRSRGFNASRPLFRMRRERAQRVSADERSGAKGPASESVGEFEGRSPSRKNAERAILGPEFG
jgi:hypothetical protein